VTRWETISFTSVCQPDSFTYLTNYCRTEGLMDYIQKIVPISRGMSVSVIGKTSWRCVGKWSVCIVRFVRDSWTWCAEKLQDVILTDVVHTAIAVVHGVKRTCIIRIVAITTVKSVSCSIKSPTLLPSLPIDVKERKKEMSEKQTNKSVLTRNVEALWGSHCCRGRAINSKYSDCVSVFLP
jgi:hypothetical protein